MNEHRPDKWLIFKVKGATVTPYRVLGTWAGGYLYGDSWRINSGIIKVESDGSHYLIHGHSGSVYRVHRQMYGAMGVGHGILESLGDKIEILPEDTDWGSLNYE